MKILILCNGPAPAISLFKKSVRWADYFIAADGGGNTARELGKSPDVVIGDLDSFKTTSDDTFEIIKDRDQETNDLEKALGLASEKQGDRVIVLGATGQRIDQTLKNLSVLKKFNSQFDKIVLRDNYGTTRLIPNSYSGEFKIGTLVSLFPLSGRVTGITTAGLKYPLNNETLENGVRDGTSNEVISTPVTITYKQGDLIVFTSENKTDC